MLTYIDEPAALILRLLPFLGRRRKVWSQVVVQQEFNQVADPESFQVAGVGFVDLVGNGLKKLESG